MRCRCTRPGRTPAAGAAPAPSAAASAPPLPRARARAGARARVGTRCAGAARRARARASAASREAPPYRADADVRGEILGAGDLWSTATHARIARGRVARGAAEQPAYTLAYMPMRNRAEVPRLLLEEGGVPYDFEVVGFLPWAELKQTTPFGRTPTLTVHATEETEEMVLAHEQAITRFLARELGMCGATPAEEARCDVLYQQYWCTLRNHGLTHEGEHYSAAALADLRRADAGTREAMLAHARDYRAMRRVNDWEVAERSLAALRVFEDVLADRAKDTTADHGDGPWLVGSSLSYVDLCVFEVVAELAEPEHVPDFADSLGLPELGGLLARVGARERVRAYLRSPARMPRYERPAYAYCA